MEKYDEKTMTLLNKKDEKTASECPHCHSLKIIKFGKTNNLQRFRCKECGKTFSTTSLAVFKGTMKETTVWQKYIESMFGGDSIRESAKKCCITIQTSFFWRHKLLCALAEVSKSDVLSGEVALETTFIRSNYKGNRKNTPKPKLYIGISSAMDQNGKTKTEIAGINYVSEAAADEVLSEDIKGEADGYTDKDVFYVLAKHKKLTLKPLSNKTYYIKKVSSRRSDMFDFFKKFKGVSTKYLKNYLSWFDNPSTEEIYEKLISVQFSTKTANINKMPAIPYIPYRLRKHN